MTLMEMDIDRNTFITLSIADIFGSPCVDHHSGLLYKKIDGEWIGKPCYYTKDLRSVWQEDLKPEDEGKLSRAWQTRQPKL